MKKNELIKFALFALAGSVCLSGQVAHTGNQELAMTKCSKSPKTVNDDDMNGTPNTNDQYNGPSDDPSGDQPSDQSDDQPNDSNTSRTDRLKSKASLPRKSAARKVIEGVGPSNNTTLNVEHQSAAKKAMALEDND